MARYRSSPGRPSRTPMLVALSALACLAGAPPISAQEGCEFGEEGNDVLRQVTLTGGDAVFYVTRPHLVCEGGIQIWADSAVAYTTSNMAHLIGAVRYEDPRRSLRADEARYFTEVGRLQAEGSLVVEDLDEGSVVENGALVYLRETSFRSEESMTVTAGADRVRPRARLTAQADSAGQEPQTPRVYVVEGDEILSRGGAYLRSVGSVELAFDSVMAFADTLEYREAEDHLVLRGGASIDAPEYDLAGQHIELLRTDPELREIRAMREAVLIGEDLVLTAERIFLFARDEKLQRLVALPPEVDSTLTATAPARPHAVADDFEITADSLEVLAPGDHIERLFAGGRARSVSRARDSLNVERLPDVARSDWLEGDTIIVTFAATIPEGGLEALDAAAAPSDSTAAVPVDSTAVAPADTVQAPTATPTSAGATVERIMAVVGARSLYRMAPSDQSARAGEDPPAVHYVVGDRITIVMLDGEVSHMEVEGGATGLHLEPLRPGPGR